MRYPTTAALSLLALASTAAAQSGVLAIGNLPSCARTCGSLSTSAQTCGGTSSSSQSIWQCFCQAVYSASSAAINSGTGLCSDTCTSVADQQGAVTWFRTQCGSDNGASEHADNGGTTTSAAAGSATSSSSAGNGADGNGITGTNPSTNNWWNQHWKWIVMLIVLAILLSVLAGLAVWLKKRHDKKRDKITSGFNAGITSRSTGNVPPDPHMSQVSSYGPYAGGASNIASGSLIDASHAGMATSPEPGTGQNSPMRTRDAFMPYGYGYTRSESKLASRTSSPLGPVAGRTPLPEDEIAPATDGRQSPFPREPTPGAKRNSRRVLVRERSGREST